MNTDELIYIAIPYSHPNKEVREHRVRIVSDIAGKLMCEGKVVFSPISHGYQIAKIHDMPTDWEYWERSCKTFLKRCSSMIVVMADGWERSQGVLAEIEVAEELGIPIQYYDVD